MSLADAPYEGSFRIVSAGLCPESAPYAAAGVSTGRHARVLARHPVANPRFVEVELDGERLLTLPIGYAGEVLVEPISLTGGAL